MLTEARTKWERMQRSGIDTINQVPHLTVDSVWESDKTHKNTSNTRMPREQAEKNRLYYMMKLGA